MNPVENADRRLNLRLHAMLEDAAGVSMVEIELPSDDQTPAAAFEAAIDLHPGLAEWRGVVAFAVETRMLLPRTTIPSAVRTLDALPPVSGG